MLLKKILDNNFKLNSLRYSLKFLSNFVRFKISNNLMVLGRRNLLNLFFYLEALFYLSKNYSGCFNVSLVYKFNNLNYHFGYFLLRLKNVLRSYSLVSNVSFFKGFQFLKSLIFDSDKKYFILYRSLYLVYDKKKFKLRNYFLGTYYNYSSFLFLEVLNFSVLNDLFLTYNSFYKNGNLAIFLPFFLLLFSFRFSGFFHLWKHRPIGNVNFVDFEDSVILTVFKFYNLFLYYWYSICDNKERLRFFIKVIQQSCLLTLARKHKKNKAWTYDIYFSDFFSDNCNFFLKDLILYVKFLNIGNFLFNSILNEFKY